MSRYEALVPFARMRVPGTSCQGVARVEQEGPMVSFSPWMVLAAFVLLAGFLHTPMRRGYPSAWFCGLLALVALVGTWLVLHVQFGGQVIQVHLP